MITAKYIEHARANDIPASIKASFENDPQKEILLRHS